MLKPAEKTGLENILNKLSITDLFSLSDTITKRMSTCNDREDAVVKILRCANEPCDILKRQKITRKVLFEYLQDLIGYIPPDSSKIELVTKCIEEWKNIDASQVMSCKDASIKQANEQISSCKDISIRQTSEQISSCKDISIKQTSEQISSCKDISIKQASETVSSDNKIMALEFLRWFFPIFNQLKDFDTKHFWPDVKCEFVAGHSTLISGDKSVVAFLTSLVADQRLYFHPNESADSVKCELEIHGMVKIAINGILHKFNNSVGTFESLFGLVRSPEYNDNWKIKWICMNLRGNFFHNDEISC